MQIVGILKEFEYLSRVCLFGKICGADYIYCIGSELGLRFSGTLETVARIIR